MGTVESFFSLLLLLALLIVRMSFVSSRPWGPFLVANSLQDGAQTSIKPQGN